MSEADEILKALLDLLDDFERGIAAFKKRVADLKKVSAPKYATEAEVKKLFPQELEGYLTFALEGENWIVKPKQFLGAERFAEIAKIVRNAGGDYVSAGRESHFRIPAK